MEDLVKADLHLKVVLPRLLAQVQLMLRLQVTF